MPRHFLEAASLTDAGRVRVYNEDSLAVDCVKGIAVLADGMGGHRAGEVASGLAIEQIVQRLSARQNGDDASGSDSRRSSPRRALYEAIAEANRSILAAAATRAACQGMGTTVAAVLFHDEGVVLGHVGDSRIYRLRDGCLELLTSDDSLLRDQVELGLITAADASESHNRHLVTRVLGGQEKLNPHLREEEVREGDVFLLCSDGLNDLVEDADIELIVNLLQVNLPLAASHLVQLANDNGGSDNISVILVKVGALAPVEPPKSWLARLLAWFR